jgi:flagellar basal-body rod protein FlgG
MNGSFYTGAVGAQQQLLRLNVYGDNIANVNSYGYKTQRADFTTLVYQRVRSASGDDTVDSGRGAKLLMTDTDFSQAGAVTTGLSQDYMIDGRGFFVLVDPTTGELSYTRNGAFSLSELLQPTGEVDENGQELTTSAMYLSDGEGRFVLSQQGGLIQVDDASAKQDVGIFDYTAYDGMERLTDSRFLPVTKDGALSAGEGTLVQGALEMSNVDLAEEMTKVIESQRAYQMALRMVTTSDEIESTINNLRS